MSHWIASVISSSPRAEGLMALTGLEDRRVEHVDADQRQVGRRDLGLLDEPHHLAVPELGDAELGRIGHAGEQDLALRLLVAEARDERLELLADQVVAQVHAEGVRAQEGLGDEDRVGESQRSVLLDVRHRHAEVPTVADRVTDLLVGLADHDADLADAGSRQRLDPIEEDGLVGHRDQLLGRGEGDGAEPRSAPAGED